LFNKPSCYLACALLILCATVARAAPRDMEKEQHIWQELQAIAPATVETFKAATAALDNNNFAEAVRLYEAVYKKTPDYDVAMRRLGGSLVLSGRRGEGLALLEAAVKKKEAVENLITMAQCLALPVDGSPPRREDLERALPLCRHAIDIYEGDDPSYLTFWAMISLKTNRLQYVRQAAARLRETHPELMETYYYGAWGAVAEKDWRKVNAELAEARARGLREDQAEEVLEAANLHRGKAVWRYLYYSLFGIGAWLVGLELLIVLGRIFPKKPLDEPEGHDANATAASGPKRRRRFYAWLTNAAGAYSAVSIPVIFCLALAVTVAMLYAILARALGA
jgi:tetratricopeptide (TPR) repeat protein